MSEPATGLELMTEYENGVADYYLEVSKNRRAAQDKFMQAYPRIALNRVEAHEYLLDFRSTGIGASLPQNVKAFLETTFMEYGYLLRFGGLSFDGYSQGPMLLGGSRGRAIARARGSLLAEGLLADESIAGAKRYATHLYSFAEYDLGLFKARVTNLTDGGEPQIEYDPPEWAEGMPTKVDPNYQPG